MSMDGLAKVWDVVKSPWALFVLAILAVAFLAFRLQAGREEIAGLKRERDETALKAQNAELKAKGAAELLVAEQKKTGDLEKRVEAFPIELQAAVQAAKKAAPGSRIVGVVEAATAPMAGTGPTKPSPRCLFAEGDLGVALTRDVQLETGAGAVAVVGESWCWRTTEPRARLFGGPWHADVSSVAVEPPPSASGGPGWGAGVWASVGRGGAVAGPALALPPLSLGPVAAETTAAAGANAKGDWAVAASLILRGSP